MRHSKKMGIFSVTIEPKPAAVYCHACAAARPEATLTGHRRDTGGAKGPVVLLLAMLRFHLRCGAWLVDRCCAIEREQRLDLRAGIIQVLNEYFLEFLIISAHR